MGQVFLPSTNMMTDAMIAMSKMAIAYETDVMKKAEAEAITSPHARYTLFSFFETSRKAEIMVQAPRRRIEKNKV